MYEPRMSLDGLVLPGHYAVIDEADAVLLDHAETLTNPHILALSATPFSKALVEQEWIEKVLGFNVIDSCIEGSISVEQAKTAAENASVEKFLRDSRGFAKIVYCTDPSHPEITKIGSRFNLRDHEDLDRLRQLRHDDIALITDPLLARGVDYRAAEGTEGIALLVISACDNDRAYVQLLGRVGRYREPCLRYVWSGLSNAVD